MWRILEHADQAAQSGFLHISHRHAWAMELRCEPQVPVVVIKLGGMMRAEAYLPNVLIAGDENVAAHRLVADGALVVQIVAPNLPWVCLIHLSFLSSKPDAPSYHAPQGAVRMQGPGRWSMRECDQS